MHLIKQKSPNFQKKTRNLKDIKYIVIHYTGMQSKRASIKRLTDKKYKVSCHYLIDRKGNIIQMVEDHRVAWHAGKSKWKKIENLNQNSIGIELVNKGHSFGYEKFSNLQIKCLIKICLILKKKYKIKSENFLGHSDIAPLRKKDPGEKFPWKYLSKNKIGIWHTLNKQDLTKNRKLKTNMIEENIFFRNLFKIGYSKKYPKDKSKNKYLEKLAKTFQRRFRQELVDGKIDQECLIISKNLIKAYN